MICSVENCGGAQHAEGWCQVHWARWSKHGDPLVSYFGGVSTVRRGARLGSLSPVASNERRDQAEARGLPMPVALQVFGRVAAQHVESTGGG